MPDREYVGLRSLRIFISYSNEQSGLAGKLKYFLEAKGFEVFIAHDDIEVSVKWREEIIKNLKRCDIFIPIISTDFKNSNWTDQETGIAVNENKYIMPLWIDIPPYGFISDIQGLKINHIEPESIAIAVFKSVVEHSRFGDEIKDFAINALLDSITFDQANTRAQSLNNFESLSKEQIYRLIEGTVSNDQIYNGFSSRPILKRIVMAHQDIIDKDTFNHAMSVLDTE